MYIINEIHIAWDDIKLIRNTAVYSSCCFAGLAEVENKCKELKELRVQVSFIENYGEFRLVFVVVGIFSSKSLSHRYNK